jgi:ApaG protein
LELRYSIQVMKVAITDGIKISVETKFRSVSILESNPRYFFEYQVTIENRNAFRVQLLRRDWFIYDSLDMPHYVSGEGVVGQKPILETGEVYVYTSACELKSEIGYMTGHYTFLNLESQVEFPVLIPRFDLIYPLKMN